MAATFSDQVKRTEISSESEQEAVAKIAKSKSTANRIAKTLSCNYPKNAISTLRSALVEAEAREKKKEQQATSR